MFFYIRRKYSQFHENLLCAPKSSPLALNVESFVSRWSRDTTPSDKGNESDITSTFYCFLTLLHVHIHFIALASVFKHKRAHRVRVLTDYIMDIFFSLDHFFNQRRPSIFSQFEISVFPFIINYRVIRYLLEPPLHNKHLMTGPEGNS